MGTLLSKSSSNKEAAVVQQQQPAVAPSAKCADSTKSTAKEPATENKENASPAEAESAKPGTGDTAELQGEEPAKIEEPVSVPEPEPEPVPTSDQPQESGTTDLPQEPSTEDLNVEEGCKPAEEQPEVVIVEEKPDQQQETEKVPEDASVEPVAEEAEALKENSADSNPPVVEDNQAADTGNVVGESNDACAEDTSANTVANGPVDSEVPRDGEEVIPKDKSEEDTATDTMLAEEQSSEMTAVVEG